MGWSGVVTAKNEAMNFHKYRASPTMLLILVIVVGIGHFVMEYILEGSILSSPPPIMYPRYNKEY
jgi:hypothetical protein